MTPPAHRCLRCVARAAAVALALLASSVLAPSSLAGQQLSPDFDQGIIELRVGTMAPVTTMLVITPTGQLLLPVGVVLDKTGLPAQRTRGDSVITLPMLGDTGRIVLDVPARTIRVGRDSVVRLDSLDAVWSDGDLYLAAPRLASLIQGEVQVDLSLLVASVRRTPPFPTEQAAGVEARRRASEEQRELLRQLRTSTPVEFRAKSGGLVLDWTLSGTQAGDMRLYGGEVRGGVAILGGDLVGSVVASEPPIPSQSAARVEGTYRRVFPRQRYFRQVEVGNVFTGGPIMRPVRGISLTNEPLFRDPYFSDLSIVPQLPAGWQYEVYQDGQLVGFSDGTTGDGVEIPLRYGSTPVQVRMISPAGEQITSELSYQVAPTQLSPGLFEYTFSAGECITSCRMLGQLDASYGVKRWLTVGGGLHARTDSAGAQLLPQLSLSLAALDGRAVQLQVVPGSFSRLAGQFTRENFYASSAIGISQSGSGRPSVALGPGDRWHAESQAAWRLARLRYGFQGVRVSLGSEGPASGGPSRLQTSATADRARGSVGMLLEHDAARGEQIAGLKTLILLPSRWRAPLRNTALNGLVAANGDGLQLAEGSASFVIGRFGSLSVSTRWRSGAGAFTSLGFGTSLGFARSQSRFATGARAASSASTSLTGSVVVDVARHAPPAVLDRGGTGSAGVRGRVFYDVDNDGAYGAADRPASGVPVLVAGQRVRTNDEGLYHTWGVIPFEISEVTVDTLRSFDASWTPLKLRIPLRATPHVYNEANFPLVASRELGGSVIAERGVATVAGVTLVITDSATRATQSTLTYADGAFYVSRLRPGTYDVTVAASSLEALRAVSDPQAVRFVVGGSGDDPFIELPPIRLRPHVVTADSVVVAVKKCPNPPPGVPLDAEGCPVLFRETSTLTLRGVNFAVGRAELTSASVEILAPIADALASDTSLMIEVAGHTDATGSRALNLRLSEARAESVRQFFIGRGVRADRVVARGYGPDQPVATNATAAGRAQNRRTELRRLDTPTEYTVEVARFGQKEEAEEMVRRLAEAGFEARVVADDGVLTVRVGRFASEAEAADLLRRMVLRRFPGTVRDAEAAAGPPGSTP